MASWAAPRFQVIQGLGHRRPVFCRTAATSMVEASALNFLRSTQGCQTYDVFKRSAHGAATVVIGAPHSTSTGRLPSTTPSPDPSIAATVSECDVVEAIWTRGSSFERKLVQLDIVLCSLCARTSRSDTIGARRLLQLSIVTTLNGMTAKTCSVCGLNYANSELQPGVCTGPRRCHWLYNRLRKFVVDKVLMVEIVTGAKPVRVHWVCTRLRLCRQLQYPCHGWRPQWPARMHSWTCARYTTARQCA